MSLLDRCKDHYLVMVSLDGQCLFRNIQLNETIEIFTKEVLKNERNVDGLSRTVFMRLLRFTHERYCVLYFMIDSIAKRIMLP